MNDKIYVAPYWTESGDRGIVGYFTEKPTEEQLTQLFYEIMPYEFEDMDTDDPVRYVFWEIEELSLWALPEGIPTVETI